jgi:ribosomal protein S7
MSSKASKQAARLAQRQLQSIPQQFSNLLMSHGNKQLAESTLSRAYEVIKKVAVEPVSAVEGRFISDG